MEMKDRLQTSSKVYANVEQSPYLDIEQVGSRTIAVGRRGVIAYSDDGIKWTQARVPVSVMLTAVYFADDMNGWAVGHSGVILHSQDRGESWQIQYDGYKVIDDLYQLAEEKVSQIKNDIAQADESEKENLSYLLEDAEYALSDAKYDKELGPANPFLDVWFRNNQQGYAVGAYGLFFATEDGGATWKSISNRLENLDKYHLNAIVGVKGGAMLIAGESGSLFISENDGKDWETLYAPYSGSFFGIQPTSKEQGVIVYGLKGHAFISHDSGRNWDPIKLDTETTLTSSAIGLRGQLTLVGGSGVVYSSIDDGKTFTRGYEVNFKAYTGVAYTDNAQSSLVLVSDQGIDYGK